MQTPPQITLRHVDDSEALKEAIEGLIDKVAKQIPRMTTMMVTVEGPSQHHRQGGDFEVRLELRLPRNEVVIQTNEGPIVEDVLHEAFKVARRRAHEAIDKMAAG